MDNFFMGRRFGHDSEWFVTTDQSGELQIRRGDSRGELPPELQAQLAFNEVATGGRFRFLNVDQLYLFRTQYVHQPANMVGLNDPLSLVGTIYEFSPYSYDFNLLDGVEGTLSVSRSDFLSGVVDGASYAFHLGTRDQGNADLRCANLLLPGDRVENIARGRGLVLTYPLMPLDLEPGNTHNEPVIEQLLYDILSSLQRDMVEEKSDNSLTSAIIPVPSRSALEEDLRLKGFSINGDVAKRKRRADAPRQAPFLTALVDMFAAESVRLPPEAKAGELMLLAKKVIASVQGWPSNIALATDKRCSPSNDAFRDKRRQR